MGETLVTTGTFGLAGASYEVGQLASLRVTLAALEDYLSGGYYIKLTDQAGKTCEGWITGTYTDLGPLRAYAIGWKSREIGFAVQDIYGYRISRFDVDKSSIGSRQGEQWGECARCGFVYPQSELTVQDGLTVCLQNCVYEKGRDYYTRLTRVPMERDPRQVEGDGESD